MKIKTSQIVRLKELTFPRIAALLIVVSLFLVFSFLFLSIQKQAEYIIFYDFWQNFEALKNGELKPFILHDMHTYVVASIVWYVDVLLANGSLRFVNVYIFVNTLGSMYCLFLLADASYDKRKETLFCSLWVTLFVFAMWFSPSNATTFANNLGGILASTLLLFSMLTILLRYKIANLKDHSSWVIRLAYVIIVFLGFLTLETFVVVPLILAIYAFHKKDKKDAYLNIGLFIAIVSLYFLFVGKLIFSTYSLPDRSITIIIKNFLLLLSSHYNLLFIRLHIDLKVATILSQCLSIMQLAAIPLFMRRKEVVRSNCPPLFFLSLLLIGLGIVSIGLATVVRFAAEPIYNAIARYTQYSMMFSIGVVLLVSINRINADALKRIVMAIVIIINFVYLLIECMAFLIFDYRQGANIDMMRLEMPLYAMHPDSKVDLGPHGPNNPEADIKLRSDLHGFLKTHQLSVFASDGYKSLGTTLPAPTVRDGEQCVISYDYSTVKKWWPDGYQLMVFKGIGDSNGFFLVSDVNRDVTNFGFAARSAGKIFALLPEVLGKEEAVSFVRFDDGKIKDVLDCQ